MNSEDRERILRELHQRFSPVPSPVPKPLEEEERVVHEELWNACTHLLVAVDNYEDLFMELESRQAVDPFGGELFGFIWSTLWSDLVLRLTRLTDPPGSGARRNISITRLQTFRHLDSSLRSEINAAVDKARTAADSARTLRNRLIAHADEDSVLSDSRIGPDSFAEIKAGAEAVFKVLYRFDLKHLSNHVVQEVVHDHDAKLFVHRLKTAAFAIQCLAALLRDDDDPEKIDWAKLLDHAEMTSLMSIFGREYDPETDHRRLVSVADLASRISESAKIASEVE